MQEGSVSDRRLTVAPPPTCLYCDRTCGRCGYPIVGGWEHVEMVQPEGSNVTVCSLERVIRSLAETLWDYFEHVKHRDTP